MSCINLKFSFKLLTQKFSSCSIVNSDGTLQRTETYKMGVRDGLTKLYDKKVLIRELKFWSGDIVE